MCADRFYVVPTKLTERYFLLEMDNVCFYHDLTEKFDMAPVSLFVKLYKRCLRYT